MPKRWNKALIQALYDLPFMELVHKAQKVHRKYFNVSEVELCTLLSIKTGNCPEDCKYCSQSGHYKTEIKKETFLNIEDIVLKAKQAKEQGATRFCMGAAWRSPPEKGLAQVIEAIQAVKSLGLETCATLGMLEQGQAGRLKAAGLDFYNHNLDTSPEHYKKIITTRTYEDRLKTLEIVKNAGIKVCCGGIMGLGESREDRIKFLLQLTKLTEPPTSVPINRLGRVKGTPLENAPVIDNFEFIRTIAVARILLPRSMVRLSAGRDEMSEEMQALCFLAGANSIHFGADKLLTISNPSYNADLALLEKLGIKTKKPEIKTHQKALDIELC